MGTLGTDCKKSQDTKQTATCLASRRWLLYTPSVEHIIGWVIRETPFSDYVTSREKRYQDLSTFPYCKRRKAGQDLGTRLIWRNKTVEWLIVGVNECDCVAVLFFTNASLSLLSTDVVSTIICLYAVLAWLKAEGTHVCSNPPPLPCKSMNHG